MGGVHADQLLKLIGEREIPQGDVHIIVDRLGKDGLLLPNPNLEPEERPAQ